MSPKDLYFISEIAAALQKPNPPEALDRAFRRIQELGRARKYRRGYKQFLRFMQDVGYRPHEDLPRHVERPPEPTVRPAALLVCLERDGHSPVSVSWGSGQRTGIFGDIVPGMYRLVLETGWVLWEGRLRTEDLIWSSAHPESPFRMAADTGRRADVPTREIPLLDGAVLLRVYAGLEAGWLEIDRTGVEGRR